MIHARYKTPHIVTIAFVILCAQAFVFASDPSLSTLEPRLTGIAKAARGEVGVSLFHVESGARLFSFNQKKYQALEKKGFNFEI